MTWVAKTRSIDIRLRIRTSLSIAEKRFLLAFGRRIASASAAVDSVLVEVAAKEAREVRPRHLFPHAVAIVILVVGEMAMPRGRGLTAHHCRRTVAIVQEEEVEDGSADVECFEASSLEVPTENRVSALPSLQRSFPTAILRIPLSTRGRHG